MRSGSLIKVSGSSRSCSPSTGRNRQGTKDPHLSSKVCVKISEARLGAGTPNARTAKAHYNADLEENWRLRSGSGRYQFGARRRRRRLFLTILR